ncbi:MAG TPA: hypothetical protein VLB44_24925 [Kofleriaceae bacterium]|nr:hypothetical protein [Kofleriaceae bacterium]
MRPERINLQSPIGWGVVCLLFTGGALVALAILIVGTNSSGPGRIAGLIGFVFTAPVALIAWATLIVGVDHLRIDVPGGMFEHVSGKKVRAVPLEELGSLTITPYKRLPGRRSSTWHKLEATGLPGLILCETISLAPVANLKGRLELAVAASAVRRVLAGHVNETEAFRAAPELEAQLAAAVSDDGLRRAALGSLSRDLDPEIRARASSLAA